jgi:hypothetical protein
MRTFDNKQLLKTTGILSVLFLIYYATLLPQYDVTNISKGIYSLDVRSSYTKDIVTQLFKTIGETGIHQYKIFLAVDFIYIFIYGALTFFMLRYLINNMGRLGYLLKFTIWSPLILMISDLIENTNTFLLLSNTSDLSDFSIQFGSAVTTFKWFAASVLVGMIICYAFYAVLRYIFWKLKNNQSINLK